MSAPGQPPAPAPGAAGGPVGTGSCALAARPSALPVIGASLPELKDLNSSMTTPEMAREMEELRKDCASYTEKLERIKSATNHVTPEEKERVKSCLGLSQAPAAEPGPGLGPSYQTLGWVTRFSVQLMLVRQGQGVREPLVLLNNPLAVAGTSGGSLAPGASCLRLTAASWGSCCLVGSHFVLLFTGL